METQKPPKDSFHQTKALQRAVSTGSVQKCSLYLQLGCDPNVHCGANETTALITSCYIENDKKRLDIITLLLNYGGDPSLQDKDGNNLLHHTCKLGLMDVIVVLAETMDSKLYCAQNKYGDSPLHMCAMNGNIEMLDIILDKILKHGQNLNLRNIYGLTPLALALLYGNDDCARKLHGKGAFPRYSLSDLNTEENVEQTIEESILLSVKKKEIILPQIQQQFICNSKEMPLTPLRITHDCDNLGLIWSRRKDPDKDKNFKLPHIACSDNIIKSLMASKQYYGERANNKGQKHQEPISQKWIDTICNCKPNSSFNVDNSAVPVRPTIQRRISSMDFSRKQPTPILRRQKSCALSLISGGEQNYWQNKKL